MKRFEYLQTLSKDKQDAFLFVSFYGKEPTIYEMFDWLNSKLTLSEYNKYSKP